ncbi:23058_t:CDS:1, partial [Gigaspora rosea]
EDKGIMFCNYCDHSVEWKMKFTIDGIVTQKRILRTSKLMK